MPKYESDPEDAPDVQDAYPKVGRAVEPARDRAKSRRAALTSDDLSLICREVRNLAGELDAVAAAMDRKKIDEIVTDGSQRWRRGCVMLAKFLATCKTGLTNAELGVYRSKPRDK